MGSPLQQRVSRPVLAHWNALPEMEAEEEILPCCGSQHWAQELTRLRPFATPQELFKPRIVFGWALRCQDWDEAFRSHPRIGSARRRRQPQSSLPPGLARSKMESTKRAPATLLGLVRRNEEYEARFGRVFLVCATGKSASRDTRHAEDPAARTTRQPNCMKPSSSSVKLRSSGCGSG